MNLERSLPQPEIARPGWPWVAARPAGGKPDSARPWPRITVVTPSLNQGKFLEEAIRSVLLQGYPNLEYMVLDGGSTDNTIEVIRKYAPMLSYWESKPDRGQSHALNTGFSRASGDILAWLNSDDVYVDGALYAAAQSLLDHPDAVLVFGNAEHISADGRRLGTTHGARALDRHYLLHVNNPVPQPSAFFRRQSFVQVGGLDENLHYAMDYDLWIRLEKLGPSQHISAVLSQMRLYPGAKTSSGDHQLFREVKHVVERHGGQGLPGGMAEWLVNIHLPRALHAYESNALQLGQQHLGFILEMTRHWPDERALAATLAGHAFELANADPLAQANAIRFAERVCSTLPTQVTSPATVARLTLGLLYEGLAFRDCRVGNVRQAARHAWLAVRHDGRRALNRGLWITLMRCAWRKLNQRITGRKPSREPVG